ncbi:MAG: hypothetical protein KC646_03740 [Candidatus Cloacimonetes bacterium]|nr:hypothetical protein [Candidatus Cloacimonadota bacterium]
MKLNSHWAINSLVEELNPYLQERYSDKLHLEQNLNYRDLLVRKIVERRVYRANQYSLENVDNYIKDSFLKYYEVKFSSDQVIDLASAMSGVYYDSFWSHDDLLYTAAQAYLHTYSKDQLNDLVHATREEKMRDKLRSLIAGKNLLIEKKQVVD